MAEERLSYEGPHFVAYGGIMAPMQTYLAFLGMAHVSGLVTAEVVSRPVGRERELTDLPIDTEFAETLELLKTKKEQGDKKLETISDRSPSPLQQRKSAMSKMLTSVWDYTEDEAIATCREACVARF